MPQLTREQKLQNIIAWEVAKPSKDSDWAEDTKAENLDVKFDHQLDEMLITHTDKISKVEKDLEVFTDFPEVKRYELTLQFRKMFQDQAVDGVEPETIEGKTIQQWVDEEFASQETYYNWKYAKLNQSVERIAKERELRQKGFLTVQNVKKDEVIKGDDPRRAEIDAVGSRLRSPIGTTYYIDADNGNNGNAGTSTGAAWDTLDQFTENARTAGDIAILRGGMTDGYDDGTDLNFTSDGTIVAPIQIIADYGDAWSDHVDTSGTATATVTIGSKTITCTADVSGVIAAGDIIYIDGDDNTLYSYEVASVVTTTVTLYLPYKGTQAGSSKTIINMQNPPHWNDAATANFQWNFDTDNYWMVQGILLRGTDANGQIEVDSSQGHSFIDVIFIGDANSDNGIVTTDDYFQIYLKKCRSNTNGGLVTYTNANDVYGELKITDSYNYGPGTGVASNFISTGTGSSATGKTDVVIQDCENENTLIDIKQTSPSNILIRNLIMAAPTAFTSSTVVGMKKFIEDYDGIVGDSRYFSSDISSNSDAVTFQSENSTVRSGGSNKSIKITPTDNMNTLWDFGKLNIFELPVYATTDSKTYTVYMRPSATTDWTADPTASELYLEAEYWGHASNNYRIIKRSTETIDMNGSTSWQTLTVTVAPAQTGVLYLRLKYGKTKESGKTNIFYVDPIPVIS